MHRKDNFIMATFQRDQLPSRQQIQDQKLTPDQIQTAETTAVYRWLVSRLSNPEARPRILEKPSVELLLAAYKPMLRRSLIAPEKIGIQLSFAADYLNRAIRSAAQPYPDLDLAVLRQERTATKDRLIFLSDEQIEHLRSTRLWLDLLINTAPKVVAVDLLRANDWIERAEREAIAASLEVMAESSPDELKS
jgi:hypothetical protein